jgi:hypothetical protein
VTYSTNGSIVFWHRELPPLDTEVMGEHTVEASSERVQGTLTHGGKLWERCYGSLMAATRSRIEQEVARLGGSYAHVLSESIDSRRDEVAGEAWLHGRFVYVLSRKALKPV